jgi:hypothetical protein
MNETPTNDRPAEPPFGTTAQFAMRPAASCPKSRGGRLPHTWVPGDGADVIAYASPDYGLSIDIGRCHYCGTVLAAVGPHGSERAERTVHFEVAGAELLGEA